MSSHEATTSDVKTTTSNKALVPKEVAGESPTELATRWERELTATKKELSKFHTTGRRLVQRYLDEREAANENTDAAKLNLFWSNIEVLKSSLYAKAPKVDVSNSFKDSDDDVSRVAGTILERMLNNDVEDDDDSTYPEVTKQAVEDYLVVGLGQVWYRYEVDTEKAETEPVTDPETGMTLAAPIEYEAIVDEEAPADHVFWEDFWWSPAKTWQEVRWVARRVYMTREELKARFGDKIGGAIPLTKNKRGSDPTGVQNDPWEKAGVFEIWDKTTKTAYWHVMGYDVICDSKPDPLKLRGFFPCPAPLIANSTTSRVMPRADYLMAQDQYSQIDELTTRIKYLVKACKVVGVYNKMNTALARVFQEGMENQMIPVDDWAAFAEKGGLKGQLDFIPIDQIAAVIERLTAQRDVLKANLYEVLGIGDIMRGMTDPDETLGAQQLKAQFGGNRLQFKQQAIGRWVAGGQRIKAQIICRNFQPQTIIEQSNILHSNDAEMAQGAIELLKGEDGSKAYRISIEAETMAMVDWAQERDSRSQFMTAVGAFVQAVTPLIQASPQAAPVVLQMMKWGLGGFRVGKEIESVLDKAIAAAQQPNPPAPPDPKTQSEIAKNEGSAKQSTTAAIKNIAEARMTHAETTMARDMLAGPGGMPMQPPPSMAPVEGAPLQQAPMR